jgi:hypothetical protein
VVVVAELLAGFGATVVLEVVAVFKAKFRGAALVVDVCNALGSI